jgi:hypothetical protein
MMSITRVINGGHFKKQTSSDPVHPRPLWRAGRARNFAQAACELAWWE